MAEIEIKKGLIRDLSNDAYHGEAAHLSSSNLKTLLKDPAAFYNEKILGNVKESTGSHFAVGSYFHALILEPHNVKNDFAFYDGMIKRGKEWNSFKQEEEEGKKRTILSKPQRKNVEQWVDIYNECTPAVELLKGCESEISLFTSIDGVDIKVRADALNAEEGYLVDLKTTSHGTDFDSIKMTCNQYSYYLSAALYTRAFSEFFGKPFDFYFVFMGKTSLTCDVYRLSQDSYFDGDRDVVKALNLYKKCRETGRWESEESVSGKRESTSSEDYEIKEV